jgi:nitroimidazol reductase NimA-like FMN-containing flavoprotein (pyridoxamine 5'-phosphate oxidase superfamily)
MNIEIAGPWQRRQIDQYLAQTRMPIRLACVAEDGFPRVVSVWYRYADGMFYCATHRDSQLARMIKRNPRIGFEVSTNEPPYYGVRGQGVAELSAQGGADTLRALIDRYLGESNASLGRWLMSRSDEELLIRVEAQRFYSWDYRKRMESVA